MREPLDLKQVAQACEDQPVSVLVSGQVLRGKFLHVGQRHACFLWGAHPTWIRLDAIDAIQFTPETETVK